MATDIYQAYEKASIETDRVVGIKAILRQSQRYGLMMVPTSQSRDFEIAVRLVALMLLQQVHPDYSPAENIPLDWTPANGTRLREDAESLARLFEAQQDRVEASWSIDKEYTKSLRTSDIPIKRITEFDSIESDPNLLRRPSFWLGLMGFSALAIPVLLVAAENTELGNPIWYFVGCLAAITFGGIRILDLSSDQKVARGKIFDEYLATFDPDRLAVVAGSPEFDEETKDAVIKYLSVKHPGWSLT